MKKSLIAWLLAAVMVLALMPAAVFAAESPEDITLTVWVPDSDLDWLDQRLDAFAAANPQWRIHWNLGICHPGDAGHYVSADPEAAADVYLYTSDSLFTLTEAGALLPLSKADAAWAAGLTSQPMMDTLSDESGSYYGIPMSPNTWFMYYNKSVYSEEDVKSLETMLEKGVVSFPLFNAWYFASFYFANGGTMFGPKGSDHDDGIRFNGPRGAAVTLRLSELLHHPSFMIDYDGSGLEGMMDGTVGACFSGTWDYAPLSIALGENLGAAQLPTVTIDGQTGQLKSLLTTTVVGVNPHCDHPEAAMALAKFLANQESQLMRYQTCGYAPAATTLTRDPAIASHPAIRAQLETAANTAVPQSSAPRMMHYWSNVFAMSDWLINDEITPENARALTEEWNAMINGGENPPPFSDVPGDSFYADPVAWALEKGITTGATDTTFNPGGTCLRAQVVTFLHRAEGSPAPTSASNPFTDVKPSDFFYKPVLWAVEKGITNGVSANEFGAYTSCNRAAVVTFLWRAAGEPKPTLTRHPFTDVPKGAFYETAVLWALENGITTGLSTTEFGPGAACNRAQVVTFLYRAFG